MNYFSYSVTVLDKIPQPGSRTTLPTRLTTLNILHCITITHSADTNTDCHTLSIEYFNFLGKTKNKIKWAKLQKMGKRDKKCLVSSPGMCDQLQLWSAQQLELAAGGGCWMKQYQHDVSVVESNESWIALDTSGCRGQCCIRTGPVPSYTDIPPAPDTTWHRQGSPGITQTTLQVMTTRH